MTDDQTRLQVSRLIKASRTRVFEAWTTPDLIVRWWGAGGIRCTAAEIDLTVGGTYRIANEAPDGTTMWLTGSFNVVDPPNGLSYTWATEPVGADTVHSVVDVTFDVADGGTLVTITHTRIPTVEARDMNLAGWLGCLDGLASLLEQG